MTKRDIGSIGEAVFASWCEQEGFIAHKPAVDRLGWDLLLEQEPARVPHRPLDAQNEMPKYLVQIKSTEKVGRLPRIKLSALKHLVDSDLPSAIAILCFRNGYRNPVRGLLVPVDERIVESTLRRVRLEEAGGRRNIHLVTLSVPIDRAVVLGSNGEGLAEALSGMLGGSYSDYVAGKMKFRKTCGYEGATAIGRFFVPGEDAADRISELFLGGQRSLDVRNLSVQHRRFDIAIAGDGRFFDEAVLTIDVPPMRSAVLEVFDSSERSLSVEVDFWASPPSRGSLPSRVRFANSYLELDIDLDRKHATFNLDYGGARMVGIGDAVTIIEIGAMLADTSCRIVVGFEAPGAEFPIVPKDHPFGGWPAAAPTLRRIFSAAYRYTRLPREVRLDEFVDWVERHIEFLALASMEGVQMVFDDWSNHDMLEGQDVLLAPFTLDFLGVQYTAVIEIPIARVEILDRQVTIHGGRPRVVDEVARPAGSKADAFVEAAIEKSKRDRNRLGPAIVAGGFSNWQAVSLRMT